MRKRDELTNPAACMARARDDEWTFVLLGRDDASPATIRFWIAERIRLGRNRPGDAQLVDAEEVARSIESEREGAATPGQVAGRRPGWLFRHTIGRLPCQHIGDGRGNDFFDRYTVLKTRWFAVYLHRFFRSDADRCLHDHPWAFVSLILRGGYWEEMRAGKHHYAFDEGEPDHARLNGTARHWRRPGSILIRKARDAHRIVLEPGTRPWSLVVVGRKARAWGFYTPNGWWKWRPGATPICEVAEAAGEATS